MKGTILGYSASADLFGDQLNDHLAPLVAAAHELKTPLSVIAYLVASLRDPDLALEPSEQAQYLERIALSTERMSRLVNGFTQAYRLGLDQRQMNLLGLEPVNAAQVSEEVLHELSPLAQQLEQTIKLDVTHRSMLAIANRQLLSSVIMNLVDNGLKHNPPRSEVVVRLTTQGSCVRSAVKDNGTEISRHDLLRLRSQFGRELQPLSGRSQSSGLGLYIASQLTRAMGGNLGAICHHASGATFYADLQRSTQLSFI